MQDGSDQSFKAPALTTSSVALPSEQVVPTSLDASSEPPSPRYSSSQSSYAPPDESQSDLSQSDEDLPRPAPTFADSATNQLRTRTPDLYAAATPLPFRAREQLQEHQSDRFEPRSETKRPDSSIEPPVALSHESFAPDSSDEEEPERQQGPMPSSNLELRSKQRFVPAPASTGEEDPIDVQSDSEEESPPREASETKSREPGPRLNPYEQGMFSFLDCYQLCCDAIADSYRPPSLQLRSLRASLTPRFPKPSPRSNARWKTDQNKLSPHRSLRPRR